MSEIENTDEPPSNARAEFVSMALFVIAAGWVGVLILVSAEFLLRSAH